MAMEHLHQMNPSWRNAIRKLEGAYSDHTLRAYRSDFQAFDTWCERQGRSALPASPTTVALFLTHQTKSTASFNTIRRRRASIRKIHKLLRLPNPADDEDVLIAERKAARAKGRRAKQALGLTRDLRDQLLAATPPTLAGLRNAALLCVGYDTLARRSELAGLKFEDMEPLAEGAMSILIRRAKNDPFGDGRMGVLSPDTVARIAAWRKAAKLRQGWMFRRINGSHIAKEPLDSGSINRILKIWARNAGLPPARADRISGHSMRVGAAQDMLSDGLGLLPIMQAGGWKSVGIVERYVQNVDLLTLAQYRYTLHLVQPSDENVTVSSSPNKVEE